MKKPILLWIGIIIIVVAFGVSGWVISRKINYSLSYEKMVEETVIEMVKEEALK